MNNIFNQFSNQAIFRFIHEYQIGGGYFMLLFASKVRVPISNQENGHSLILCTEKGFVGNKDCVL